MADSPTIGKVLYFDPNNTTIDINGNISDKPLDLMQNPEDLCIGVDLQVTVKNQSNITSGDKKTTYNLIGPNTRINFLEGENLGGVNVLTDFFANIGDKEGDVENIHEAMCVSSIDIEFSSWYAASVVINFTDVRGTSLMSESDYVNNIKENNLKVDDKNQSLFKSFFDFPYPMYILKIKGFYGDAVSYPLHCSDFKATFNATTGNFDIVVSFIGYTYAMLNDVQMSYLMAAPYCKFAGAGSDYWDAQVANGRFLSSDGTPLPKIVELMNRVKNGDYEVKKISQNTVSSGLQDSKNERSMMFDIKDNYIRPYLATIKTTYNSGTYNYELNLINIISKEPTLVDGKLTLELNTQITNITKKIVEFKEAYPTSTVFNSYNGITDLKPKKVTGDVYEIILKPIGDAIVDLNDKLTKQITDLSNSLDKEKNNSLTEAYQMKPNIFNYFKVLVAHMETFYNLIDTCNHKIPVNRPFDKNMGLNSTDLNIKYNNGIPILSPFPWYSQLGKDGRMEDAWIGDVAPNLLEVELVNSLINAKTDIQKELDKIKVKIEDTEPTSIDPKDEVIVGKIYYPINAFDNTINLIGGKDVKKLPYDNISEDLNIAKEQLRAILAFRISTIALLSSAESKDKDFALAEALNILETFSNNEPIINIIKDLFLDIKNGDNKSPLLKQSENPNIYKFDINGNNNQSLPVFESDISTYKKYFGKYGDKIPSYLHYYTENNVDNDATYIKIIDNTTNCDYIIDNYFKPLETKIKNSQYSNKLSKILEFNNLYDEKFTPITQVYFNSNNKYDKYQPILNKITYTKIQITNDTNTNEYSTAINANYDISTQIITPTDLNTSKNFITSGDTGKTLNSKNLYKIYSKSGETKNNITVKEIIQEKLKKLDINYTYPIIGGISSSWTKEGNIQKNGIFSLFGHPLYYNQNTDRLKSLLFLSTLDIDYRMVEKTIKDSKGYSNNFRLPKSALLLLGGSLWRKKNNIKFSFSNPVKFTEKDGNKIYVKDNSFWTKLPEPDEYFSKDGQLILNYLYAKYPNAAKGVNQGITVRNNELIVDYDKIMDMGLSDNEIDCYINYFLDWVISNKEDGWLTIKNGFELKYIDGSSFSGDSIINFYSIIINKKINEKKLGSSAKYLIDTLHKDSYNSQYDRIDFIDPEVRGGEFILLLNKDNSTGVNSLLNLLFNDCIITTIGRGAFNEQLKINRINNIIDEINSNLKPGIIKVFNTSKPTIGKDKAVDSIDNSPDMKLAVYAYLKTVNDKWVSGFSDISKYQWITNKKDIKSNVSQFKAIPDVVGDYYIRNFRFIDRAHNDIGLDMLINYRQLFQLIDSNVTQKTLFSAMTDVLQQNQMLFLPMPSYQSFDNAKDFSNIFKPIPFVETKLMSNNDDYDTSMYLCMYAGRPSSKLDQGQNGTFGNDGYSLNKPEEIPNDYLTSKINQTDQAQVPAIAVNFGEQNQQYFKNMSLNMSNPNTTDASIMILKNLNDRANQNATVEPIGQDLFSLYSQYSYSCEVEMMGCPQIQPMMYFQLNNIPMWNGAYMIFKIKHSIKPGTMTTNFTGMRMAKTYPKLISQNAISFKLVGDLENYGNFMVPVEGTDKDKFKDITTPENSKLKFIKENHFFVKDYFVGDGWKGKNVSEKTYNRVSYLSQVVEKIYSEWTGLGYNSFNINSGFRDIVGGNDNSAHLMGLAVDIQIPTNTSKDAQNSLFSYIQTMMSKGLPVDELILETKNETSYWIHIGLARHTTNDNKTPIIKNSRYETRGLVETHNCKVDGNKYPELTKISEAMWPNQSIGDVDSTKFTGIQNINQKLVIDYLKGKSLSKFQVAGIMGNIMQESKFKLDYPNGNASTGLIHWATGSYGKTLTDVRTNIGPTVSSQMDFLTNGSTFGYSNWINQTNGITDIYKVTELFSKLVEKPGKPQNEKRGIYANEIYQRFNDPNDYLYWG